MRDNHVDGGLEVDCPTEQQQCYLKPKLERTQYVLRVRLSRISNVPNRAARGLQDISDTFSLTTYAQLYNSATIRDEVKSPRTNLL